MIRPIAMGVLILASACGSRAQTLSERFALNNIHKHKWERAKGQLKKSLKKDSLDATAQYVYALYFFTPANPDFQVDSAYQYTVDALTVFRKSTGKQKERMKRFPLDSAILIALRDRIDSAAFERAKNLNTEKAYLTFLSGFPLAAQRSQAMELRDEVAYLDALKMNTYPAFLEFLTKYPKAERAGEAQRKYEKLLYEVKTKDKKLLSYESFLTDYPNSPYRKEVEQNIFEIITASGEAEAFLSFLKRHPGNIFSTKAKHILYYLLEETSHQWPSDILTDSIKAVQQFEQSYLVPFIKDGKFGFMDKDGTELIKPSAEELDKEYLCGNVSEDIIVLPDRVLARNGFVIFSGKVDEVGDLGFGFLKIESNGCIHAIHKTGFSVGDSCALDMKLLNGRFIAMKRGSTWSLWTLTGRKLLANQWDEITAIKNVFIFKKSNELKLASLHTVAKVADQEALTLNDSFDDVRSWPHDLVWVKTDAYQGVLDQKLDIRIAVEKHTITPTFFGAKGLSDGGVSLYNWQGEGSSYFQEIKMREPWVSVKKNNSWRLIDPRTKIYDSPAYDSIAFIGPTSVGFTSDTVRVYFDEDNFLEWPQPVRIEFLPGKDSVSFLQISEGEKKTVFDSRGKKLFTVVYDKIQYAGHGIFIVHKKEKKGLITSDGKPLLPVEFDAIGSVNQYVISLLKSMRFGLFDFTRHIQIKPQYDKNLTPYNREFIVAFQEGFYGFIRWDNKPLGKFEFEEVRYWNDTLALVKKNFSWMLYDIKGTKIYLDKIKDYKLITDSKEEKIAIIHQENNYGVISNVKGTIIPITFSDIINLGSKDEPLYFTEKHVEEASIFVVIYYDRYGKLLRRQVFEEDDYERIYCSDN